MEAFAQRLDQRMRLTKIDRKALSAATGAHRNQISEWLNAKHWPSAEHLLALSRELGVSIDWLLSGDEPAENPGAAEQSALSLAGELARLAPPLLELVRRAEGLTRAGSG